MLFKYKVTTGVEGFPVGGHNSRAADRRHPYANYFFFSISLPDDTPHHEVFLSSQLWLDKLFNDLNPPRKYRDFENFPPQNILNSLQSQPSF